jgi:hypothetical protein
MPTFRINILSPFSGLEVETVCFSGTLESAYEFTWRQTQNNNDIILRAVKTSDLTTF